MKVKPLADRVLVKQVAAETKTAFRGQFPPPKASAACPKSDLRDNTTD